MKRWVCFALCFYNWCFSDLIPSIWLATNWILNNTVFTKHNLLIFVLVREKLNPNDCSAWNYWILDIQHVSTHSSLDSCCTKHQSVWFSIIPHLWLIFLDLQNFTRTSWSFSTRSSCFSINEQCTGTESRSHHCVTTFVYTTTNVQPLLIWWPICTTCMYSAVTFMCLIVKNWSELPV
jgi:hypothetical protein